MNKKLGLILISGFFLPVMVMAAMSSTNYFIYADSVDFGGGLSTSTNFNVQDSVGGNAVGISTSTSYEIRAGYQSWDNGSLSFSLDTDSINFGNLPAAGTVATAEIVATISITSDSGYTMSITDVGGTSLSAVSDGAVDGDGGSEEYGLAVSGLNEAFADDQAIVDNLELSQNGGAVSNDETTMTFKAVRSSSSVAATYSQNITLTVATNL